jgi:flavin reductase (DIM6/NTAB) family NADH-FMN oxidoreductase RutF
MMNEMNGHDDHLPIQPKILYYGMPVILLTTINEDGTTNISPISSSWALGQYLVLGIGVNGKAFENLQHTPQLVINIPDSSQWENVEKLAHLTGKYPVPESKTQMGIRHEKDKFSAAGLNSQISHIVQPARIRECPLQIECEIRQITVPEYAPSMAIVEVEAKQVHAISAIVTSGSHINPASWQPLIYNFRHYYPLGTALGKSYRAQI